MPLIWSLALLASVWLWGGSRRRFPALAPILVLALGWCVGCGSSDFLFPAQFLGHIARNLQRNRDGNLRQPEPHSVALEISVR